MVRCTVPVWTTILQYFITGERISRNQSISLLLIVIGSVMVCYGDVFMVRFIVCDYDRFGLLLLDYAFSSSVF